LISKKKYRTSLRCFPPSFGHLAEQLQRRRHLEINQSETRMVCGDHVCKRIRIKCAIFKKNSPLKPLGQMNRNLEGSILGWSSIKIAHLILIRLQTWSPQTILVSDWLISKKSSPLKPLSHVC
jgi:hypothetical protein